MLEKVFGWASRAILSPFQSPSALGWPIPATFPVPGRTWDRPYARVYRVILLNSRVETTYNAFGTRTLQKRAFAGNEASGSIEHDQNSPNVHRVSPLVINTNRIIFVFAGTRGFLVIRVHTLFS